MNNQNLGQRASTFGVPQRARVKQNLDYLHCNYITLKRFVKLIDCDKMYNISLKSRVLTTLP